MFVIVYYNILFNLVYTCYVFIILLIFSLTYFVSNYITLHSKDEVFHFGIIICKTWHVFSYLNIVPGGDAYKSCLNSNHNVDGFE